MLHKPKAKKRKTTATTAVALFPTPNAMLDVWWLLVALCTVDGVGEIEMHPAKRGKA
jgi:hypothetical protein